MVLPSKLEIGKGGTTRFTATASGIKTNNDIFRYQWMKRGSKSLPDKVLGVNETVLIIPNITESDEGLHYCVVTNEWDRSLRSNDVNFTVYGTHVHQYRQQCMIPQWLTRIMRILLGNNG